MLVPFVVLLILLGWGLKEVDLYFKEAAMYGFLGLACLAGILVDYGDTGKYFVIPLCLVDAYLIFKMIGNPKI
jgi:hypothetical protein